MSDHFTLRRATAAGKIRVATSATYYFQRAGGTRYERQVTDVEALAKAFEGTPKAKCRVRHSDSQHTLIFSDTRALRTGYVLTF